MSYLDITFTNRNPFTNDEVRAGVDAARAVFAARGDTAEAAFGRTMARAEENGSADPVWEEADYAAMSAMCAAAGCTTAAAENATLELIGA